MSWDVIRDSARSLPRQNALLNVSIANLSLEILICLLFFLTQDPWSLCPACPNAICVVNNTALLLPSCFRRVIQEEITRNLGENSWELPNHHYFFEYVILSVFIFSSLEASCYLSKFFTPSRFKKSLPYCLHLFDLSFCCVHPTLSPN